MKIKITNKCLPLLVSSMLVIASGCSDFLTESDPSNFTVENYFTKPEHATSAVNAVYDALKSPIGGGGYGGAPWMMLEFQTGLASTDLGQAVNNYYVLNLTNTSDNGHSSGYWNSYYRGIANANLAIAKIPGITMDEVLKKKLLGEAYFLRAWYYFYLVRIFGSIPLITDPVDLNSEQLYPKQATADDVYKQIVADLLLAESSGLGWTDVTGRINLAAVKSVLSTVYLTMAGFPLAKGASYYKLAADKAAEVIDGKQYKLFTTYADLHNPAKKNVEENVFMVQFKTQIQPSDWQVAIIPYNKGISAYSDETGSIYANSDFVKSYEANDLRTREKQFYYTTYTRELNRKDTIALGGYFLYKYFDDAANLTTANSDLNRSMVRYAQVLLDFAEASNEANGPSDKVYEAINQVRKRAELPALAGLTKDQLRTAIWKERIYELSFENVTWFDYVRWRKAFNVKTKLFEDYVGHKFSYGPVLTKRELLFPIPTDQIRNNTNLVQNEGY